MRDPRRALDYLAEYGEFARAHRSLRSFLIGHVPIRCKELPRPDSLHVAPHSNSVRPFLSFLRDAKEDSGTACKRPVALLAQALTLTLGCEGDQQQLRPKKEAGKMRSWTCKP
jgi:hypothetical protein